MYPCFCQLPKMVLSVRQEQLDWRYEVVSETTLKQSSARVCMAWQLLSPIKINADAATPTKKGCPLTTNLSRLRLTPPSATQRCIARRVLLTVLLLRAESSYLTLAEILVRLSTGFALSFSMIRFLRLGEGTWPSSFGLHQQRVKVGILASATP